MNKVSRSNLFYAFKPDLTPVLHISPGEEVLLGCPMDGFTIAGPYGSMHGELTFEPGLDLTATLYYADNRAEPDPPEDQPGHYGETGVNLTGWEQLGRGEYRLRFTLEFHPAGAPAVQAKSS